MKSYSVRYAGHTRSSRVNVPLRPLSALHRVVALEAAPRFVLVNVSGDHVVLDYGARYEVRKADGTLSSKDSKAADGWVLLWAASLMVDDQERDFTGARGTTALLSNIAIGDRGWALEMGDLTASYVVQQRPRSYPTSQPIPGSSAAAQVWNTEPTQLTVASVQFDAVERNTSMDRWLTQLEGSGCGAIGDDRLVAVAMSDGRFFAYDANAQGDNNQRSKPLATARLSFVPLDISMVETGIAVTSRDETTAGHTVVHLLDRKGSEVWKASVALTAAAPPIDAAGGRVYLIGDGYAAAEAGKTLWVQKTKDRAFATALADGSALVAVGPELRSVSRDGKTLHTLRIPEGDAIVAPPAVAGGGSVWIATSKALYAAQ
jgi:hypothetical protein